MLARPVNKLLSSRPQRTWHRALGHILLENGGCALARCGALLADDRIPCSHQSSTSSLNRDGWPSGNYFALATGSSDQIGVQTLPQLSVLGAAQFLGRSSPVSPNLHY
jgi:hypothetical protein